jgi:hypothetical protein
VLPPPPVLPPLLVVVVVLFVAPETTAGTDTTVVGIVEDVVVVPNDADGEPEDAPLVVAGTLAFDGGDWTGAVPPDAAAAREGLSLSGESATVVPCTAAVTCAGVFPPVNGAGGTGGPPPGGEMVNDPGATVTVCPPDEKPTSPWLPMLAIPLEPFTCQTTK